MAMAPMNTLELMFSSRPLFSFPAAKENIRNISKLDREKLFFLARINMNSCVRPLTPLDISSNSEFRTWTPIEFLIRIILKPP